MAEPEDLKQTIRRLLRELLHDDPLLRDELRQALLAPSTPAVAEASIAYLTDEPGSLTDSLDFSDPPAIRLRGHRIWLEDVLYEHVYRALNADELAARFPTLTLAEIHAVLLYYYRHQATLDRRLAEWLDASQRAWAAQQRTPAPVMEKLRRLRAERDASVDQATASSLG